jgi:hypothetical protein
MSGSPGASGQLSNQLTSSQPLLWAFEPSLVQRGNDFHEPIKQMLCGDRTSFAQVAKSLGKIALRLF